MPPGAGESAGTSSLSGQPGHTRMDSRAIGRRFRWRSTRPLAAGVAVGVIIGAAAYGLLSPGSHPIRRPARLERVIADWPAAMNAGLAFSPNGMLLAVAGMQSTAVYNLATGTRTVFVQHQLLGGTIVQCALVQPGRHDACGHGRCERIRYPTVEPRDR